MRYLTNLGVRLREYAKKNDKSIKSLAEYCGTNVTTFHRWIHGDRRPGPDRLAVLRERFPEAFEGIGDDELLERSNIAFTPLKKGPRTRTTRRAVAGQLIGGSSLDTQALPLQHSDDGSRPATVQCSAQQMNDDVRAVSGTTGVSTQIAPPKMEFRVEMNGTPEWCALQFQEFFHFFAPFAERRTNDGAAQSPPMQNAVRKPHSAANSKMPSPVRNQDDGEISVVDTVARLAEMAKDILPLAERVSSDEFTAEDRRALRNIAGEFTMFELSTTFGALAKALSKLCGERARSIISGKE